MFSLSKISLILNIVLLIVLLPLFMQLNSYKKENIHLTASLSSEKWQKNVSQRLVKDMVKTNNENVRNKRFLTDENRILSLTRAAKAQKINVYARLFNELNNCVEKLYEFAKGELNEKDITCDLDDIFIRLQQQK